MSRPFALRLAAQRPFDVAALRSGRTLRANVLQGERRPDRTAPLRYTRLLSTAPVEILRDKSVEQGARPAPALAFTHLARKFASVQARAAAADLSTAAC